MLLLPLGDHALVVAAVDDAGGAPRLDHAAALGDHAATALARIAERETLRDRERTLREENERLERFARTISHDLRNPLNVVLGRLELYRETGDPDHVDDARVAAERMQELLQDLLSLAREGRVDGDSQPTSLLDVAERAVRSVDEQLALDATDHVVESDPGRLQELVENLARNAAEHGDATTLRVGALEDGVFYVGDDGAGIPPEQRDRVFDPGYSTADEGTGFGLAIVRAIAEAHGWSVSITGGAEGGARFEFRPTGEGTGGPPPVAGAD